MKVLPKELKTKIDFGMLFTTRDVAEMFHTHQGTVLAWAKRGMPQISLDASRTSFRYDICSVAAWIKKNKMRYYRKFVDTYGEDVIKI